MYFSGHFMTIFRSNYFHLKFYFFYFFLNIRYIYANVFKIFKFELNPLDNKKDIGLYVLFRTFHDNFQVKLFPLKKCFFNYFFSIFVKYMLMYLRFSNLNSIHWIIKKIQAFMYFSGHFRSIFQDISVTPNMVHPLDTITATGLVKIFLIS
jgi:hypothetical protein